jgi:hypothetical protein
MTGFKQNLANYQDKKFKAKVELGDDGTYDIKGFGSTSFRFQLDNIFHFNEILYVPGLKKNLISVPVLESKGYSVAFSKGKALLWSSNEDINTAITIGTRESGLYKISGQVVQALVHETVNPCELWHKRLGHLNYNALPGLQKMVTGMPVFSFEHDSVCKGCSLGKNTKKPYPLSNRSRLFKRSGGLKSKSVFGSISVFICMQPVITRFVLVQSPPQDPKFCVTMEESTTVIEVQTSLVLVMERGPPQGRLPW